MNREVFKAYIDHFLPREIIGPVIIVFSLEGVISGLFDMYVPTPYETVAWAAIFFAAVYTIAHWGTTGEAEKELEEKIDEIRENE